MSGTHVSVPKSIAHSASHVKDKRSGTTEPRRIVVEVVVVEVVACIVGCAIVVAMTV